MPRFSRADQIKHIVDQKIVPVFAAMEDDMLRDIARRISKANYATATVMWELQKAQDMNLLYDELTATVARYSGMSEKAIRECLKTAGVDRWAYDEEIFSRARVAGLLGDDVATSDQIAAYLRQEIDAAQRNALDTAKLTNTRAIQGAVNQFSAAVDKAYLSAITGTIDPRTAMRSALRELGAAGVQTVNYASGRRISMEAAVRMNMITATNQTCARLTEGHIDLLGGNLVEVTSHAGARPAHAEWQGKIFWTKQPYGNYSELRAATGYGTAGGLCGVNCRHNFYPYFPGLSTKGFDRDPAKDLGISNDKLYEQTQEQRRLERKIRAAKRTQAAAEAAGDGELSEEMGANVRAAQKEMREYLSDKPYLVRDYDRERVA